MTAASFLRLRRTTILSEPRAASFPTTYDECELYVLLYLLWWCRSSTKVWTSFLILYSKVDSTDWPHFNFSISYIKLILCDTLQLLKGKLLIISAKNLASIKQNIALRGFSKTKSIKKLIAYFFKFFAILRRIDNASDFL